MARAVTRGALEVGSKSCILAVCKRIGVCAPTYIVFVEVLTVTELLVVVTFSVEGVVLGGCELEACAPRSELWRKQILTWCLPLHTRQLEDDRQSLLR